MNSSLHHIRLVAGFEIRPGQDLNLISRTLTREACQRLAATLADDLARVVPEVSDGMLVVGGSLLEPAELLSPGFRAWQALRDLADPVIREQGSLGRILAIGTHQSRLPDARLRPPEQPPQGQMLTLPILLIIDQDRSQAIASRLEAELLEKAGIQPPTRAILAECAGLETAHGQLLTLADQLALHQIQLDTAGLGAFWPPVEHALLDSDRDAQFTLPGALESAWHSESQTARIEFFSFDQFPGNPVDYAIWVRAFRSLCALFDSHDVPWQASSLLEHDSERDCLIEDTGPSNAPDGLTTQIHPDCGLLAWTLVEKGRQLNFYPLSGRGFKLLNREFRDHPRGAATGNDHKMHYDSESGKLCPAK